MPVEESGLEWRDDNTGTCCDYIRTVSFGDWTKAMATHGTESESVEAEPTVRLFLLGAGFSKQAGLPLASELLAKVVIVARENLRVGEFSHLEDAVARYEKFLLETNPEQQFDIEQFGAWLDWDHTLELQGPDTFSEFGNEAGLQLRWAIGKVLHEHTPESLPSVYLDFARQLNPTDEVLTLNYDLVLEMALEKVGIPFRRFPFRFSEIHDSYQTIDPDQPRELVIRKLHGSIDWTYLWGDSIKYPTRWSSLVEGPRPDDDPLRQIGVIPKSALADYYRHSKNWHSSPLLLFPPSAAKPLARSPLIPLWRGIGQSKGTEWLRGFTMIGCSLPAGDPYIKQLAHHLATVYGRIQSDNRMPWPLRRMKVVDFKSSIEDQASFRRTLGFFYPECTDFVFEGFSENALSVIFDN